ncbi:MAG TPA: glucose 1-dehydrogenase [Opitutaceae bacterium]|nr:glucose 1-dehydrogenase [Opitutaceae bacterium]
MKPGRLENLVSIVTGGASGFGESICRSFVQEGARVIIADLNESAGQKLAETLQGQGAKAEFIRTDVSQSADMKATVEAAVRAFGRLDIMVNNAGISHPNQSMLDVSEEFFDRLFAVNVKSIYHSAIHCVPLFRSQGGGCFINIGSTAAVRPRPGLCWYSGSKGSVTLLTKAMAVELAPDKIRVNALNPALAETPLLPTFLGGSDSAETRSRFLPSIPLGRFCQPTDVAHAALFLADPLSGFVTGVCMEVDGGRCI